MSAPDTTVISRDIEQRLLHNDSWAFFVVGTSDECRVTFSCVDEITADMLVHALNNSEVVGVTAEVIR